MKPSTRDDLIEEVRYGRMVPAEAEAEAARLGVGKLSCEPADGTFDPMGETWWTLTMAVAWIAWRTPKLVRGWWAAFRSECWEWHSKTWRVGFDGRSQTGHELEQWHPANLSFMRLTETYNMVHGLLPDNSITCGGRAKALGRAQRRGDGSLR